MILSHKSKFCFVKGRKVGSTSCEFFLSQFCGPRDIITPITPIDELKRILECNISAQNYGVEKYVNDQYIAALTSSDSSVLAKLTPPVGRYFNHMPIDRILKFNPEILNDYYIFAVERSPYSKIISLANMSLGFLRYKSTGEKMISDHQKLKSEINKLFLNDKFKLVRNLDLYKYEGKLVVDVINIEKFESNLIKILGDRLFKDHIKMPILKQGLISHNLNPYDFFTKSQLTVINDFFFDEFDNFKFKIFT